MSHVRPRLKSADTHSVRVTQLFRDALVRHVGVGTSSGQAVVAGNADRFEIVSNRERGRKRERRERSRERKRARAICRERKERKREREREIMKDKNRER